MTKLSCTVSLKGLAFFLCAFASQISAAATSLPIGTLEQHAFFTSGLSYNTNPNMTSINEKSVWQLNLTPRYRVSNFNDLNEWYVDLSLLVVRSSDKQIVIDRENPVADIGWKRELERGNIGLKLHYDEASSLVTEFDESGVVSVDSTRIAKSIEATWDYILTERLTLGLNSSLSKSQFTGGGTLVGNRNKVVGSSITYAISDTLKSVGQISWTEFIPDSGQAESKNLNYNAGFDWSYSPNVDFGFRMGMNKISGQNSGSGKNLLLNYAYRTERSVTTLNASRSVAPSGLGGLIESDRLSAGWSYDLSDRSSMALNYSMSKNNSLNSTETTQYSANYNYDLSERWRAGANASYRELDDGINNTSAKIIGFTLSYDHPVF